jgi:inosine-uridine nucleoside N-ribohydrolase
LTNAAIAAERAPEFLSSLIGLVCLGGAVGVGGDATAAAEFNIHCNPQAARDVLLSPATKTLVPLDVSNRVTLTLEQLSGCLKRSTRTGELLHRLLPYAFRAQHQFLGVEALPVRELVAVAAVSRPQLFKSQRMVVDVETRGELTRGVTVVDRRRYPELQPNIDVLTDVDVQGVLDYLDECLRTAE